MTTFLQIVAIVAVIAGTFFSLVGVVGYVRLPDVYTRLHATGKVGVFGGVLLLAAAVSGTSLSIGKGLVLIALLLIIGPVTSHAIASAAYRVGIPMVGQRNDLQRDGALAGQRLAGEQGQVQDG
ncbi:MAG: monovalent cation/H(+) antiporter subunit G [Anaerolineales bacterium]|nr:monovalent cation/H(+) antiporter subunit G [Anaerolineales bacterium]MCB8966579.1 monovalent cation/H(+) antiporter subunit G [Ardenticatenaceae bacterium]